MLEDKIGHYGCGRHIAKTLFIKFRSLGISRWSKKNTGNSMWSVDSSQKKASRASQNVVGMKKTCILTSQCEIHSLCTYNVHHNVFTKGVVVLHDLTMQNCHCSPKDSQSSWAGKGLWKAWGSGKASEGA